MIVATALVTGNEATPQLAEAAVRQALTRASLAHAQEVLLFLTPDFSRHATASVSAASRAAQCLQVFGGIAAGVINEESCAMDRPAAVAMVLADLPATPGNPAQLSWCGRLHLPDEWQGEAGTTPRYGLLYADSLSERDSPVWQGARLQTAHRAALALPGLNAEFAASTGYVLQSPFLPVGEVVAHDLKSIGPKTEVGTTDALRSLKSVLPAGLREMRPLPLHFIGVAVHRAGRAVEDTPLHMVLILSINADGSLTLSEKLAPGDEIAWALRLPDTAEADMSQTLTDLARRCPAPAFGAFFSCIGRGPFFYAGEDRDWQAFRRQFPGLPFIGAYGSGQLFPASDGNRLLQNSVVSVLFSSVKETA